MRGGHELIAQSGHHDGARPKPTFRSCFSEPAGNYGVGRGLSFRIVDSSPLRDHRAESMAGCIPGVRC